MYVPYRALGTMNQAEREALRKEALRAKAPAKPAAAPQSPTPPSGGLEGPPTTSPSPAQNSEFVSSSTNPAAKAAPKPGAPSTAPVPKPAAAQADQTVASSEHSSEHVPAPQFVTPEMKGELEQMTQQGKGILLNAFIQHHTSVALSALQSCKEAHKAAIQNKEAIIEVHGRIIEKGLAALKEDYKASRGPSKYAQTGEGLMPEIPSPTLALDHFVARNVMIKSDHYNEYGTSAPLSKNKMKEKVQNMYKNYVDELEGNSAFVGKENTEDAEKDVLQLYWDAYVLANVSRLTAQVLTLAPGLGLESTNRFLLPDLEAYSSSSNNSADAQKVIKQRKDAKELAEKLVKDLARLKEESEIDNILEKLSEGSKLPDNLKKEVKSKLEELQTLDQGSSKRATKSDAKLTPKSPYVLKVGEYGSIKAAKILYEVDKVVDQHNMGGELYTSSDLFSRLHHPDIDSYTSKMDDLRLHQAHVRPYVIQKMLEGGSHPTPSKVVSAQARNIMANISPFAIATLPSEGPSLKQLNELTEAYVKAHNSYDLVNRFIRIGAEEKYDAYKSGDEHFKKLEKSADEILQEMESQRQTCSGTFTGKLLEASLKQDGSWHQLRPDASKAERVKTLNSIETTEELSSYDPKKKVESVSDCMEGIVEFTNKLSVLAALKGDSTCVQTVKDKTAELGKISQKCANYRIDELSAFENAQALAEQLEKLKDWEELERDMRTKETTLWIGRPQYESILDENGSKILNKISAKTSNVDALRAESDKACAELALSICKYSQPRTNLTCKLVDRIHGAYATAQYAEELLEECSDACKELKVATSVLKAKGEDEDLSELVPCRQPSWGIPGKNELLDSDPSKTYSEFIGKQASKGQERIASDFYSKEKYPDLVFQEESYKLSEEDMSLIQPSQGTSGNFGHLSGTVPLSGENHSDGHGAGGAGQGIDYSAGV